MKFRITLKDPDGVGMSIDDVAAQTIPEDLTENEKEVIMDLRRQRMSDFLKKWIEFDEYVTLEFDTNEKTATVVERS